MGFREVTMLEIKEVLRRWLRGEAKSEIARQCGVARGTVRSYIKAAEAAGLSGQPESPLTDERLVELATRLQPEVGRPRGEGWDRCQAHRAFISARLKDGVRLTKIRKLLRRQKGALVSYATLRRFAMVELGFGEGAPTMPVSDGEPGKEVQLDTGWVGWLKANLVGRRRRVLAWIITLGFLEYVQVRGFVIDAARVKTPTDKARVERTVRVVAEDCFGGEELLDLEHARQHALQWCRDENGMTRHGTTRRLPREHFEAEERARLYPAPTERYDVPLWCDPKVHPDQHAQVDYALYSLPRQ